MTRIHRRGLWTLLSLGALQCATSVSAQPLGPYWTEGPGYGPGPGYPAPPPVMERPAFPERAPAPSSWSRGPYNGPYPAEAYEVPPPPQGWMEPPAAPQDRPMPSPYGRDRGLPAPRPMHPRHKRGSPPWASDAENIDSDADGVPNLADICPGTFPGAVADIFGCDADLPAELQNVKFQEGAEQLSDESSAVLDIVATTLVANPSVSVEITGYAQSAGDHAQNMQLSARRAVNVMKYLAGQGVSTENMIARGLGDDGDASAGDRIELLPLY